MPLTFDQDLLVNIHDASKRIEEIGLNVQDKLTEKQVEQYLSVIRELSKDYMNIVGLHALHLIETSSVLLSRLQGANQEEKSQLQRICSSMDQFVALVKQNQFRK